MPKENTHLFFAHELLKNIRNTMMLRDISGHIPFFYLGSVIPDTFYYSSHRSIEIISETLHGKEGNPTNQTIFKVLDGSDDMRDIAFILGYITHCALDITFHPIAYYLSGNYYDPEPIKKRHAVYMHRYIETCMDVYLENPLRIYNIIDPRLSRSLKFEEIICDEFSVSPADIRRTLRKQLFANRLFASNAAYKLAGILHRYGTAMDVYEYLGLFYGHVTAQGNCIPRVIPYRDIVSGTKKTTSVKDLMNTAKDRATAMMEAAYEYSRGAISKERLAKTMPGESLDTGKLHAATTNSIRFTSNGTDRPGQ